MNDEKYMQVAINEAKKAFLKNEIPVGAVIVEEGKVISVAHNEKDRTGIVTKHAEIIAIERANLVKSDWRLSNCIIYITLEPCPMCASAIQQSRISKVVYGSPSNNKASTKIIKQIFELLPKQEFVQIKHDETKEECINILNEFFNKMRKK